MDVSLVGCDLYVFPLLTFEMCTEVLGYLLTTYLCRLCGGDLCNKVSKLCILVKVSRWILKV